MPYTGRGYYPITNTQHEKTPNEATVDQEFGIRALLPPTPAPVDFSHTDPLDVAVGGTVVGKPNSALDVIMAENRYRPSKALQAAIRNQYALYGHLREQANAALRQKPVAAGPGHIEQKTKFLQNPASYTAGVLRPETPNASPVVTSPRILGGSATYGGIGGGLLGAALAAYATKSGTPKRERLKQILQSGVLGLLGGGLAGYAWDAYRLKNK